MASTYLELPWKRLPGESLANKFTRRNALLSCVTKRAAAVRRGHGCKEEARWRHGNRTHNEPALVFPAFVGKRARTTCSPRHKVIGLHIRGECYTSNIGCLKFNLKFREDSNRASSRRRSPYFRQRFEEIRVFSGKVFGLTMKLQVFLLFSIARIGKT